MNTTGLGRQSFSDRKSCAWLVGVFGGVFVLAGSTRAADPAPSTTQPANTAVRSTDRRGQRNDRRAADNVPSPTRSVMDQIAPLRTRSIFIKGNQTVTTNDGPSSGRSARTGPLVDRPESSLVFNGVTIVDEEADALIEDLYTHKVNMVRPGDAIAGGKVSEITFSDLIYEAHGVSKHVAIGQNLDAVDATFTDTAAVPTTNPVATGVSTPVSPAGTSAPRSMQGNASAEDILARMKAKRQQELGGK